MATVYIQGLLHVRISHRSGKIYNVTLHDPWKPVITRALYASIIWTIAAIPGAVGRILKACLMEIL